MNEEHAGRIQVPKSSRKRIFIAMALVALVAIAGWHWMRSDSREPSYDGKPLSYWLTFAEQSEFISATTKDPAEIKCREAIRHIGTNAIPVLLRMLQAKDTALKLRLISLMERQDYRDFHFSTAEDENHKAVLGFYFLADLATNSIREVVDIYNNPSSISTKESADTALKAIFPASGEETPYWIPPQKRAQWCCDAGRLQFDWGCHSNAVLAFSKAIKLDPTNAQAYLSRADSKFQLKNIDGALDDVKKSLQIDSTNQAALFSKGLYELALKDFSSADIDLTRAIDLNTNDSNAYGWRGAVRANLHRLDDARVDLTTAIKLAPQEATFYRNRAMVEVMQKEYESALADASKSIELNGEDPVAYMLRGRIKDVLKDYESSLPDFDKAVQLNPKDPAAFSARGAARMYMDDFDNARADLNTALQLDPKSVAAYIARGCLKAKRGDNGDSVLADLERAAELGGQKPEPYTMLGLFQYKFSHWTQALSNCRKAMKLGASSTADLRSYIWLIRTQTGEETDARRELEDYLMSLKGSKTNEWEASIARFLSGDLSESNFLEQATATARRPSAVRSQTCESFYYAGMKRKLAGDKQGAAELFQECLDTGNDNNFGYMNAGVEMQLVTTPNTPKPGGKSESGDSHSQP